MELTEYEIKFESQKVIKAQVLANFMVEMTKDAFEVMINNISIFFTLFINGSSYIKEDGVGIVFKGEYED